MKQAGISKKEYIGFYNNAIDYEEHIKLFNNLNSRTRVKFVSAPIDHFFEKDNEFSEETLYNVKIAIKKLFEG